MAQSVSNDALWVKLSEIEEKINRCLKAQETSVSTQDYYMRLTALHSQYREIEMNYNEVVKHLKTAFAEKIALALLYKLEKATIELVAVQRQIIKLTEEFERKHLP